MYARVARSQLPSASLDQVTDELRRHSVPAVKGLEGFLHAAWLADADAGEAVTVLLVEVDPPRVPLGGAIERWDVLAFAGRLGGAWCLVHRIEGDQIPSVLQAAVDRAVASAGSVGAIGLADADATKGLALAFTDERPAEGHGGRLYRVLTSA